MVFVTTTRCWSLLLLLPIVSQGLVPLAAAEEIGQQAPFYTCEQLTPDLCDLTVEQGQHNVMGINVTYWKYTSKEDSTFDTSTSHLLPIVTLHGGPALTHNYLLPLKQQACRGRPVYFYDQAGCGKSRPTFQNGTAMTDKQVVQQFPWLIDPDYYATKELPALLDHWNLHETKFHIVGNSWGSMLAQLYVLHSPSSATRGLQGIVLSGPFSDSQAYIRAQWDPVDGSIGTLPDFLQKRIKLLMQQNEYDSPEYQAVNEALAGYFSLRTQPNPDCWINGVQQGNMEIYVAMQGPSEFTIAGALEFTNVTGDLHKIKVPVLLTHGKYDTMRPSIVKKMQEELPNAQRVYLERSGHVSMIDEPQKMNNAMANFYDQVEANLTNQKAGASLFQHVKDRLMLQSTTGGMPPSTSTSTATWYPLQLFSVILALMVGFLLGDFRARRIHRMQYTSIPGH